ncbi:hypothetical protein CC79DRAFT_1328379 [Sarocladium strictum]
MPGIYLEKTPPPSPTIASFQHLVIRRHRSLFLACCMLLAITSLYTLFAVASTSIAITALPKDHELRPITLRKGEHGRVRSLIPQKIWQIMLPKGGKGVDMWNVDPEQLKETNSWLAKNIDYQYQLVGPRRADAFVEANFADNERLLNAYHNLTNMGMKSDLLRYLLLHVEGGVYSDIDTVAIRPVDAWIPRNMRDRVKLVVGIEFDKRDGPNWGDILHDLQFCQWTIAAAPGHPVFMKMVDRILDSLDEMSATHGVPVSDIVPSSTEVMNSTGPAAWTDIVFETLQGFDPSLNETKDLSFMDQATLLGDILVLTIDGFGMGQQHSASTNDGSTPSSALIKHQFWGSWREPTPEDEIEKQKQEQEEEEQKKKEEEETRMKAEQSKADAEAGKTEDEEQMRQKAEAQRLADEALRMQEAQRLEKEAEKLREGAERLAEEAQRQKEEALKSIKAAQEEKVEEEQVQPPTQVEAETQPSPAPASQSEAAEQVVAEEAQPSASPAADIPLTQPSPAPGAVTQEVKSPESEDEVLAVDTSAPPVVKISKEEEDFNAEEDEVLAVDTSTPPWPGEEWAP